jgi:hypothetical protein
MFGNSNGPLAGIGNGDAFLKSNFGLESEPQEYEICENWGVGKRESDYQEERLREQTPNHVSRSYGLWKSTM